MGKVFIRTWAVSIFIHFLVVTGVINVHVASGSIASRNVIENTSSSKGSLRSKSPIKRSKSQRTKGQSLKPQWSGMSSITSSSNQSFLNNTSHNSQALVELLDPRDILILTQQLNDLNRDYNLRKNFGLVSPQFEASHTSRLTDFSKHVFGRIQDRQIEKEKRKLLGLIDEIKNSDLVKIIEKPAAVLVAIMALYSGKAIQVEVADNTKVSARAAVPSGSAQISVMSPLLNGSVDVLTHAPAGRDPTAMPQDNPLFRGDERYKVSLIKNIHEIGFTGGLHFLSTSRIVGVSIGKGILPNLNCTIHYFYPLDPARSDIRNPGENILLSYGMSF
jgi:hypothetical protein